MKLFVLGLLLFYFTALFFTDFVNALSAPIQHLSAAEKREQQMRDMGIDEKDISDVPVVKKHEQKASNGQLTVTSSSNQQSHGNHANAKKDEKKRESSVNSLFSSVGFGHGQRNYFLPCFVGCGVFATLPVSWSWYQLAFFSDVLSLFIKVRAFTF